MAQSLCADKNGIETILNCLKLQEFSNSLSKWCIWIIMVRFNSNFFDQYLSLQYFSFIQF
jgi:hypothetical protein